MMKRSSISMEETLPMINGKAAAQRKTSSAARVAVCSRKQRPNSRLMKIYMSFAGFLIITFLVYTHKGANVALETEIHTTESQDSNFVAINEETEPKDTASNQSEKELNNATKATSNKNNLVLHIGPQKTGSTSLQDAWNEQFGILRTALKLDNYRYRFIHPNRGFFDCDIGMRGGYQNCEPSTKLKGLIRNAKNEGKNLLLSDENLDENFSKSLRNAVDEKDWNVTVIVVYRRIHEWLHSWYDQINKTTNKDAKGNILLDEQGRPYRREHTMWPDEGGAPIPTFSTWYKDFVQYWDPSELVRKHRTIAFIDGYKPYFDNIVVHNVHQDGDLVTDFMCDSLPDAPHSCNLLKNRNWRTPRDNKSVELDYDILAVEAREKGILHTLFKRKDVASRIQKFVIEKDKHIPRVCDMKMIGQIKNWLLDSEKALFPKKWSDEHESTLKESFEGYLNGGKLCDIDFERVFEDEEWLEFFRSLDNRPHLILHIGPQKTGSTTLQYAWSAPKSMGGVLKSEDNFEYHFIHPYQGFFDCDINRDRLENCTASQKMKNVLSQAARERRNLILSDENLDERYARALREVISDKHFRVKVVLVYRRIHQWLPSWYSQLNKEAIEDADGNILLDKEGRPRRQPHTKWPDEGGIHIPNFTDWYQMFLDHFSSSNLVDNHPSIYFKKVYEPLFDHIEVYDMSQGGDFATNFMCQMIPEASTTCQRLKEGKIDLPLQNPSINVEHDIVSVHAYEHMLVDKNMTRSEVVEKVRMHLLEPEIALPRICDPYVTNQIHGWLFESEMRMFPETWTPEKSEALEVSFEKDLKKGKFCDIDVESVLKDKAWIDFFS